MTTLLSASCDSCNDNLVCSCNRNADPTITQRHEYACNLVPKCEECYGRSDMGSEGHGPRCHMYANYIRYNVDPL